MSLQMLSCEPDVRCVKTVLESVLLSSSEQVRCQVFMNEHHRSASRCSLKVVFFSRQAHPTNDPFESNLSTLVLRLVDDHEWREHFLKVCESAIFPKVFTFHTADTRH